MLLQIDPSKHINDTSKEYALYTCENRAIPKIWDGLKDSQRKALYIIQPKASKIKTISLSGEMISSNLYLHGDGSASSAISLLAAPYCNNYTLLEGIGTFGTKVDPTATAAPRYTYVKKSKFADKVLYTDSDIIPMKENYDGSTMEPVHYLPIIPLVLLNGISGIAYGWSTDILPRKLEDLIEACILTLQNKKIAKITPHYEYLDLDIKTVEDNKYEFWGKVRKVSGDQYVVEELPPEYSLEKFIELCDTLEENNKIKSFVDNSTDKIEVVINFHKGSDIDEDEVLALLKLVTRKTERIVVIDFDNKAIKQYESAEDVIINFVKNRFTFYIKRYENLLAIDSYELIFFKGVRDCFDKELPKQLKDMNSKKELEDKITTITKNLDDKQIDKITSFPTYKWTKDQYAIVLDKIKDLEANIKDYTTKLGNHDLIKDIYIEELKELKKQKFDNLR